MFPIVIGLTGTMGSGKSTILSFFQKLDKVCAVWSADAAVSSLYEKKEIRRSLLAKLSSIEGESLRETRESSQGSFDAISLETVAFKSFLSQKIQQSPGLLKPLEKMIHQHVREMAEAFIQKQKEKRGLLCLLEVPLLFEVFWEEMFDKIIVVTAPRHLRSKRLIKRKNMTPSKIDFLEAKQLLGAEKIKGGDYILNTTLSKEKTKRRCAMILGRILVDYTFKGARRIS